MRSDPTAIRSLNTGAGVGISLEREVGADRSALYADATQPSTYRCSLKDHLFFWPLDWVSKKQTTATSTGVTEAKIVSRATELFERYLLSRASKERFATRMSPG